MTVGCLLGQSVSQYTLVYCDVGARQGRGCIAIQSLCPRHSQAGRWAGRAGHAEGAQARRGRAQGAGTVRARAGLAGRRWAQAAGWGARWERHGLGEQGRAAGTLGGRGLGAGSAAWARGLARAVHSVHSACFRPDLTLYFFLSQIFGHCS